MKNPLIACLIFVMAMGGFSFAEAVGTWTLTASCDYTTSTLSYSNPDGSGSRYYAVYQGVVGNSDIRNASFAGNVNTYDQANTCDDLGTFEPAGKVHTGSYWFAAVYPAANASAWATFLQSGGSQPSGDYGIFLCDTFGCLQKINSTIGTSSALGILSDADATTTLNQIGEQCSQSGNVFSYGICVSFAYLFLPSSEIADDWAALSSTTQSKFPFSWVAETKTVFQGLSAGATTTPTYTINLGDLGIGSTTPMDNIMPNVTALSSTTIHQYIPAAIWNAMQTMMAAGMWVFLGMDIYFTVRRRHAHV